MAGAKHYLTRASLALVFATFFAMVTLIISIGALICSPYRLIVIAIARTFRPDLAKIVTGGGNTTFVFSKGNIPTANICIFLILDGKLSVTELRDLFKRRVLNSYSNDGTRTYEKLGQNITRFMGYGFYQWADHFDLNYHVREYDYNGDLALPATHVTEKDLEKISGKLISEPWLPGRSNWEFLLIDNFRSTPDALVQTVMTVRISHAIADGYSVQELLFKLGDSPQGAQMFSAKPPRLPWLQRMFRSAILPFRVFWDMGMQIQNMNVDKCGWTVTRSIGRRGNTLAGISKAIPIEKIKEVKNRFGVSYAAVLLSVLSATIHRIMTEAEQSIPSKMYCLLPVPRPNHPGGLTNHVYAGLIALPIFPAVNSASLTEMDLSFKETVKSTAPMFTELLFIVNSYLPLFLARLVYFMMYTSIAVGIFPVVSAQAYFSGCRVINGTTLVASLAYPATNGATVSMGGVNGLQRISICLEESAFSHPAIFSEVGRYLDEEMDSLMKLESSSASRREF